EAQPGTEGIDPGQLEHQQAFVLARSVDRDLQPGGLHPAERLAQRVAAARDLLGAWHPRRIDRAEALGDRAEAGRFEESRSTPGPVGKAEIDRPELAVGQALDQLLD